MALDIGIENRDGGKDPLKRELVVSLQERHYAFLVPYFKELYKKTGQMIVLYDDARFIGAQLDSLHEVVDEALTIATNKPAVWKQHIGTQLHPKKKEIYSEIRREELLVILRDLKMLVEQAQNNEESILCFGD